MNPDISQLEINVNLYAVRPDFKNLELHYIIAENESAFRFANWEEIPKENEQKFYCFLQEKELFIPAGNIFLKESYALSQQPVYPVLTDCKDFLQFIKKIKQNGAGKAIRQFSIDDLETIKKDLEDEFERVETHLVASPEMKHHIFVVEEVEISVAPTMVYFRTKAPFAGQHYQSAKED